MSRIAVVLIHGIGESENIGERQVIRAECVKFIGQLNESTDPEYDRIVVIGHSLGSVIAYDALKFLWAMQDSHASLPHSVIEQGATATTDGPLLKLYGRNAADPVDGPPRQAIADPANNPQSFSGHGSSLQSELFKLLMPGTKWKISNLVTVGSPLTHAPILFSESLNAFWELQKQRELPTSPPRMDTEEARGPNDVLCGWKDGNFFRLHHAALFAVVEWTNFYLECDPIWGPLRPLFGDGVCDIRLMLHPRKWSNHTRYWRARGQGWL
jgi:pimeloyl-ACP methyl ester carboxylesterase